MILILIVSIRIDTGNMTSVVKKRVGFKVANDNYDIKTLNNIKPEPLEDKSNNTTEETLLKSQALPLLNKEDSNISPSPNFLVCSKMENIIDKMQDEVSGVPVKTVKSLITKIPSVFTGVDFIQWLMNNLQIEDIGEAIHLAHMMACYGYVFPIDEHILNVKNDGTFYRFQTPFLWPSNQNEPENTDYAVYLCKRTMQNKARLELGDYEAENLARLQKLLSRKWEFIYMQAEAQAKVDRKRDKLERQVLDSQERAFWDVYRPVPGSINVLEADMRKTCRSLKYGLTNKTKSKIIEELINEIEMDQRKLSRGLAKMSKVIEFFINYSEQYSEHDPFLTLPEPSNPWISDNTEFWESYGPNVPLKELPVRRVKKWTFSLKELLKDPVGREQFMKFLEKEYSAENLKFYEAWKLLKTIPSKLVKKCVQDIYETYFSPNAQFSLNIDCKSENITKEKLKNPDRNTFDEAAEHIYQLMRSDSYNRFIRSETFKEILNSAKKKIPSQTKSILPKITSLNKSAIVGLTSTT